MKIYSWNVNGIRAVEKKGLLEPFLRQFDPDVIGLQEIKASAEQVTDEFATKYRDYEQFWYPADRKGYSGTAIFSKIPPLSVHYGLSPKLASKYQLVDSYGDTTKEGRILALEFELFYFVTVYTPNAKDDLTRIPLRQQWDSAFLAYLKLLEEQKPVIFGGDLNVAHQPLDLARPKENEGKKGFTAEERTGFSAYLASGFVDTLRHFEPTTPELYTWWSAWGGARERNVGWRIDYLLTSPSLIPLLTKAKVHPEVMGSDHCPVSIDIVLG